MKNALILAGIILTLAACNQDPYHGKEVTGVPPKPAPKPTEPEGINKLQPEQEIMDFTEGKKSEYFIRALVKNNGTPVVQFTNLPAGAVYDKAAQKIIWTPDYAAANDPRDPSILVRRYKVDVSLFSSNDMSTIVDSRTLAFDVKDTPKPASVKSPLDMNGREGQILAHVINFEDQEYPNGPFEIALSGLPLEAELVWPDRRVPSFTLRWTPGYTKVHNNPGTADFNGDITLYNPRGKRLQFSIHWSISNQAVAPTTAGPNSVAQPGDLDFIVMAEDPNGEESPEWTARVKPSYGFFNVTSQPVTGPGLPKSTGIVSWKGVPKDKLGTVVNVELSACVNSAFTCSTHKVSLLPMPTPPNKGARQ